MKAVFAFLFVVTFCINANSQRDSVLGKQYYLKGKIVEKVQLPPHCGIIASATVIRFEVHELIGVGYQNKKIGMIVTCPEFYKEGFFEQGKTYKVKFSDKNQAGFEWAIINKELLKKNSLPFEPYAISIEKVN